MKSPTPVSNLARGCSSWAFLMLALSPAYLHAETQVAPPALEFSSGLPGKQVRLSWAAQAGGRYAVEKSTTLASGGAGGWEQVAMVEASGTDAVWLDPVATTTKVFYRIMQPLAEVFSISPPVLSTSGGALVVHGQCIPAGSFLVIQIPGQAPILVPLSSLGSGEWQALVGGTFAAGDEAAAVSIQDGNGVTLVTLNQPLEITQTGLAVDGPPSLPPAPPTPQFQSNPVPGIGIIVKTHGIKPNKPSHRMAPGPDEDCDDADPDFAATAVSGGNYKLCFSVDQVSWSTAGGGGGDDDCDGFDFASSGYLRKKGYDYYKANSDLSYAGSHSNPYFTANQNADEMPALSRGHKHPDLMKREMGPGAFSPAPSGLPGEVSFQFCALALDTPAGPPLQLIHTYRSKPPVSVSGGSGTAGSHWESCYDISIEPIPVTAGSSATRLLVRNGGCRADVFYRQLNGSYRCDGMFREGSFVGDTFTLTFADKGTWTFRSLSDPNAPGQIAAITDRNNVALTCAYDGSGRLERVSSQFGQQLTMTHGTDGSLSSVSDHTGRSVYYTYCGPQDPEGNEGDLKSISAPQVGSSSPFGATTFTYLTGQVVPTLNGNLRSITDGANRLLEAFTYSTQSDPTAVDFDTCATHDRHRTSDASGGVSGELVTLSFEPLSSGGYMMTENDELGRVIQTTFDRLHREISVREYTGFATPGAFVTTASLPLTGKLHDSDPDFFETTCAYNADSCCTRITRPDGSQELTTYDRNFRRDCPVRERGNVRVMTLRAPGGEIRTVSCDYLPDFGTPECRTQSTPIKGISVKAGRNPRGNIAGFTDKGWDGSVKGNYRKGWDGSVKGILKKEEGGRHTPFHNKYRPQFKSAEVGGITAGVIAGIVVAALTGNVDEDCDGKDGYNDADKDGYRVAAAQVAKPKKPIGTKQKTWLCSNFRTRIISAHGQVSTFGYDANGNCTSYVSPLPSKGQLYQYNAEGQRTSTTVLNGPNSSFTDECIYDPATHFLSSVVSDSAGLHLTTTCESDNLGRVTRLIDPSGNDWLYAYNTLDDCIQIQSPPSPSRISTSFTIDAGGRVARCDVEHRAPDGSLVTTNPAYSTFYVRDARANLIQVASEERPVNSPPSALAPAPADLASYDVCDITLGNAGQVVRVSTPAACREQAADLAWDFSYNERGLLDRCVEGGLGTAGAVTTEYTYDSIRAVIRCSLVVSGITSPQSTCTYDGFHRLSSVTDPMGNVTEYAYANDGSVTTSLYGEVNDVVGSTGNLLLSRRKYKNSVHLDADHAINTKGTSATKDGRTMPNPFFNVETEDDTITVERFTPGSTAPPATEVTVIDRSPAGLVQSVTRNGGLLLSCEYDTAGRGIRCADGTCSAQLTLDACGDVLSVARTDISGVNGVASKTFTTSSFRDPFGRVTSCTAGSGNVTSITYDSLSRPVSITEPGRPPMLYAYDGGVADATGDSRYSVQVSCDISSTGSPQVLSSALVRSGECRSTTDANGYSDVFSCDALGRTTRCDHPDGTFEETTFNALSFPSLQRCMDGTFASCDFDLNGRPTLVTRTNAPPAVAVAPLSLGYDGSGRLVHCEQGASLVTFAFDSCGNPVSETTASGTVARTFNHRGRTGITYPDGKHFNESRNTLGQLLAITNSAGGNVVTLGYAGHRVVLSTQGNGVVSTWSYRGDTDAGPPGAEDFSFDACVRSTVNSPTSVMLSDERTFRDRSQQVARCETRFAEGPEAPYRSKAFTLDGLGRITACVTERRETTNGPVLPESSVSYVLAADGRRISEQRNGALGAYTQSDSLPPLDFQMGQYTTWPGSALPLEWDDNGNLHIMTRGATMLDCVHNDSGQLVAVNDVSGTTVVPVITYAYDASGRRVSRTTQGTPSVTTTFVYDGDVCVQELGTDGLADLTFVSSGGIQHCISTRNGTIYYPHGGGSPSACGIIRGDEKCDDRNLGRDDGCTSLITSATGAPVERFDCDDACKPVFLTADGIPTSSTSSSIGLRWLSSACAWEPEIGMFACSGGIYNPDLGTVVSDQKDKAHKKEYVGHVTLIKQ